MTRAPKDVAASVRARLLHLARKRGDDFQFVLARYTNERLLYRLSLSKHHTSFIVKGATLFTLWTGHPHRATRDVGFGDAVTPQPSRVDLPALLDFPAPHLLIYPRETVVAEKLDAIVRLGMANSRMKDFYDLFVLARRFEFDGALLVLAIRATFERRATPLPVDLPVGLTSAFAADPNKATRWSAFVRKSGASDAADLRTTIATFAAFAGAPLTAAAHGASFVRRWPPGGPWG